MEDRANAELEAAIAALIAAARRFQEQHPDAEGLGRFPASRLEIAIDPTRSATLAAQAARILREDVREAAQRERAVVAGSAFCLRCGHALCEHAVPGTPREVFSGWTTSGQPEWKDFGQLLVDRGDPRVDRLYGAGSNVLALTQRPAELSSRLLPAFRPKPGWPELLGQVSAGWFRVAGVSGSVAISLQLLTAGRRGERRIFLHPVVDSQLQAQWGAIEEPPWRDALRVGREEVAQLERLARTPRTPWPTVLARVESILGSLAANLERPERARSRLTNHAEFRSSDGRPTSTAQHDLATCPDDRFLRDVQRHTWIVLGPKGRTHCFADDGRLVTSVRYSAAALTRRLETGRWRPGPPAARTELLEKVRGRPEEGTGDYGGTGDRGPGTRD